MNINLEQDLLKRNAELEKELAVKNRELEIEASLERVRTTAMAMKEPADMLHVCRMISDQLLQLGFKEIRNVQTAIIYPQKHEYLNYQYFTPYDKESIETIDYRLHSDVLEFTNQMLASADAYYTKTFEGKELEDWREYRKQTNQLPDPKLDATTSSHYYFYSIGSGALGVTTYAPLSDEQIDLFKRFRNVFELAYRRFIDIEKALAQAREAQIEAALEKVRSRSLAMRQSEELEEVIMVVSEQLQQLQFRFHNASFVRYNEQQGLNFWLASPGQPQPYLIEVPYLDNPIFTRPLEAFKNGDDFIADVLTPEENHEWLNHLFQHSVLKHVSEDDKKFLRGTAGFARSLVLTKHIILVIGNYAAIPYTDEQNLILKRFGNVFQQAYTRFLDLQKAEAQAREAQIEAALERVRAKVMAMTNSKDLNETSLVFGEQLRKLGIDWQFSYFWLVDELKNENTFWITWPDYKTSFTSYTLAEAEEYFNDCLVSWRAGVKIHDNYVPPEGVQAWLDTFQRIANDAGGEAKKIMVPQTFSNGVYYYDAMMKYGSFGICISKPATDEEKKIQSRFAIEFERAYTRFLDLKKAEAQAREARIETALEKVRASTMAMQRSEDLSQTAFVLFNQFKELGEAPERIFIATFDDHDSGLIDLWGTDQGGNQLNKLFKLPVNEPTMVSKIIAAWQEKKKSLVVDLQGEELQTYLGFLKQAGIPVTEGIMPHRRVQTVGCFSNGVIGVTTSELQTSESVQLLERFAGVFDLTYTRFLDLQKAEAQAHEAKIETALERVRARALAMQEPEELKEVAQVLRTEMGLLGVEELETSSIYIHSDDPEIAECWYALRDPKETEKKMVSDHFQVDLKDTWVGREMQKFYTSNKQQTSIVMQGAHRKEWIEYCYKHSPVFTGFYGETIPDRTYHLYKFSHGYIGAAAPDEISNESWRLLSRAASVFSLAYSRFRDLSQARIDLIKLKQEKKKAEDALTELQVTQKQLIQAEKMASLGELTAGIAHEIQNPLNFVNNFSDVSNELLEEMKVELEKGNAEEAKAIAIDVKENLEKILHHGKRADAIVKGMLQHSRNSSGQKELTDINVLAEEYLRLAYHGLRAKDKFFNAKFETVLDPSINKINIVPQEIGRVILNLINNSFYAVSEKKKNTGNGYEPTVTVSTKAIRPPPGGGGLGVVEIRVKDNGNGIPQKVLDKIFQPFFTTKPTGQGTGLGLSLSYDIITKGHDGEIKVETKEGEGSEFTITLPMN